MERSRRIFVCLMIVLGLMFVSQDVVQAVCLWHGTEGKPMQVVSRPALNVFMANGFPTSPMMEDLTEFKIAPGIFTYEANVQLSSSADCAGRDYFIQSGDGINGDTSQLI